MSYRYTKFDFVCFHVATWYLHRLCLIDPAYCPTLHNIHRLIVAALLVASKATDGAARAQPSANDVVSSEAVSGLPSATFLA